MGTNYYEFIKGEEGRHIGKRSAAGPYCWNCGITLCQGGKQAVHEGRAGWYDTCPQCGTAPFEEGIENSAAGRELGFNKGRPHRKAGVCSCSSFTWATDPVELLKIKKIIDEYGRNLSGSEFYEVLQECPIQFYDSIGSEFS